LFGIQIFHFSNVVSKQFNNFSITNKNKRFKDDYFIVLSASVSEVVHNTPYSLILPFSARSWAAHGFHPLIILVSYMPNEWKKTLSGKALYEELQSIPNCTVFLLPSPTKYIEVSLAQISRLFVSFLITENVDEAYLRVSDADMIIYESWPFLTKDVPGIHLYNGDCCKPQIPMHSIGMKIKLWRQFFGNSLNLIKTYYSPIELSKYLTAWILDKGVDIHSPIPWAEWQWSLDQVLAGYVLLSLNNSVNILTVPMQHRIDFIHNPLQYNVVESHEHKILLQELPLLQRRIDTSSLKTKSVFEQWNYDTFLQKMALAKQLELNLNPTFLNARLVLNHALSVESDVCNVTKYVDDLWFLNNSRQKIVSKCPEINFNLDPNLFEEIALADVVSDKISKFLDNTSILLWHRTQFESSAIHNGLINCPRKRLENYFVHMTDSGKSKYCLNKERYSEDFHPMLNCNNQITKPVIVTQNDSPVNAYCLRETAPVAVLSVDCMIAESGYANDAIIWNLLSMQNKGAVYQYSVIKGRWALPRHVQIYDFDELACIGTSLYPWSPGHFYNEVLPRLLYMDDVIPEHVPLLWPDGEIAFNVLLSFKNAGLVSNTRKFVINNQPRLHRARRMYILSSDYGPAHSPLILFINHNNFQKKLHKYMIFRHVKINHGIIILSRGVTGQSRSVQNQNDLIKSISKLFPKTELDVLEVTSKMSYLDVSERVYQSDIIMGPHGANLNNILAARFASTIIEFGFETGMIMPSDYFCLSRNLGLKYWLSPSILSSYTGPMIIDVLDVINIVNLTILDSVK